MSIIYGSIDGYGFCVEDVTTTRERIMGLLEKAPILKAEFLEWLDGADIKDVNIEDLSDFRYERLAGLVADALNEMHPEIHFDAISDEDGLHYVMLCSALPWQFSKEEKILTIEDVDGMFEEVIATLSDEPIEAEYLSVKYYG